MDQVVVTNNADTAPPYPLPIVNSENVDNGNSETENQDVNGNIEDNHVGADKGSNNNFRNDSGSAIGQNQIAAVLEEMKKVERVILPLPETKEQLENLIYRYRYISQYRDHNKLA